jgi:AcrR family transcriptional regulator
MEDKDFFLNNVWLLFQQFGAKSLTMDDVAKHFAMSKKTLYLHYKTKDDLLNAVLALFLDKIKQELLQTEQEVEAAVEALLISDRKVEALLDGQTPLFVQQLLRYYPAIFEQHQQDVYLLMRALMLRNIAKGITQGHYRDDFDAEIYIKFVVQLFFAVETSPLFADENNQNHQMCYQVLDFFMNAMLNEKGRVFFKEVDLKYRHKSSI